jgi:putative transposase
MPWSEISPMSQRKEFIELYVRRQSRVSELCAAFGVSEKTGYKWIARYHDEGPAGLADRSRAPHESPQRVPPELIERIVALRKRHPTYGPRKLRGILQSGDATIVWPAPSTIYELLKCRGLVRRRRRSRSRGAPWDASTEGLSAPTGPNDVWAADFKGQFRLTRGAYCYPLTITDLHSRYLLGCTALASTAADPARVVFTRVFREFGLPRVIRTDNGVPFAQPNALGRLSALSVWWIRLGIRPERITPGAPQQNGQHERMHRTLKDDATYPPGATLAQQQRRFNQFRSDYNTVRPHESLDMQPPARHYTPSSRSFPRRLPPIDYPAIRELRLVGATGAIRFRTKLIMLTQALAGEYVSLEETNNAHWTVCFGPLTLGVIDEQGPDFTPGVYWLQQAPSTTNP